MKVSRSGYYSWQSRDKSKSQKEREALLPIVINASEKSKRTFGTRRIAGIIRASGTNCGREKARNLMKMANVTAKQKKKFKVTTDSSHSLSVSPNLLNRNFNASSPDMVYVSDITYIWTSEGWIYLAVVLDLFSRRVVGWAFNRQITKELVKDALRMALWRRNPAPGLVFHSDRGSQYCSNSFQKMLKIYGIKGSMSRKGDCWDNAVAESFFGSLKTERIFFNKYKTREQAKRDIIDYIEMFYNSYRLHSYLGFVCPRDFEDQYSNKKAA